MVMRALLSSSAAACVAASMLALQAQAPVTPRTTLDIYFIDTEGGQATLFVTPAGQSMLVDTGYAGTPGGPAPPSAQVPASPGSGPALPPARDADRIVAAMKEAGVNVLDFVVITHYHGDHVGGAADLAARVPIRHFYDHGPYTVELQPNRAAGFNLYKPIRDRARAIVPRPGDRVPLEGLDVQFVSAAGELLRTAMPGVPGAGAANPFCKGGILKTPDPTPENQESLGLVARFGLFRLLNLGDLTWNQEQRLVCPNNLLGTVDVFHTTRHGDPNSGAPQLVHALGARVAVMNNGERKGGAPAYWQVVRSAPGLEDLWQLHRSAAGGDAHNAPEALLANVNETDHGYSLKMSVRADGSFSMTNGRTGFVKEYEARSRTPATR
jgi:beta-lactamase superfamily II metal-dependent hydrolase